MQAAPRIKGLDQGGHFSSQIMAQRNNKHTKPKDIKSNSLSRGDRHLEDSDLDEIDHFHRQKSLVLLGSEDEVTESEQDEGIMDLPSSEEDYDLEGGDFDQGSLLDSQEEDEGEEEAWGKSKKNYYEADEGEVEEAKEAARLQRRRLAALKEEDFAASTKVVPKDAAIYFSSEEEEEEEDIPEESQSDFDALLMDFKEKLRHLKDHLEPTLKNGLQIPELKHGMEFLRVKHRLLLAYCTCVAYYITMKVEGKNVTGHPVFDRLVEYRLLLERIKPLEIKLQPQIDRLLHAAAMADQDDLTKQAGAVQFIDGEEQFDGSNLDNMVFSEDDENDANKVYKAPRVSSMTYPEKEVESTKQAKYEERMIKRQNRNRLLRELENIEGDVPEEELFAGVTHPKDSKRGRHIVEKDAYEEENMLRLSETRKDKWTATQRAKPRDELEELDQFFDDVKGMKYDDSEDDTMHKKNKKLNPNKYDDLSSMSEIEDDLPARKPNKKARLGTTTYRPISDHDPSLPRPATYNILKNRGQTPHRPKELRNPRVHNRRKFERKQKKLGSFRPQTSSKGNDRYGGERTGIRTNVSKSVRF